MDGDFFPVFTPRAWVLDNFFDGSPESQLEKHREEQGKAEVKVALTIQSGDWPSYRGPNRDGVVVGPKLARDWTAQPPKELWRQPVGGGYAAFSVANGFLVTIEQRRKEEVVVCYEAATGREVWRRGWEARFDERLGGAGPRATPTIANGDVYALGATGRLVHLNGETGEEKWFTDLLADNKNIYWAMSGSPLVVDDMVIVNPGAQTNGADHSNTHRHRTWPQHRKRHEAPRL